MWRRIFNLRGNLGSLFGGNSKSNQVASIQTPTFQQNQSFNTAQNNLATLGTNILSGNLPSYYSGLGQTNSPQFQATVANTTGQINNASAQQAAASGTDRSGVAATAAAGNLANVLPQMNYQDYLNAQQQQQGLLSLGTGITQDVAANGLADQSQVNNFNQQNFSDQMQQAQYNNQFNQNAAAQNGQAIGSLINGGLDLGLAPFTGGTSLMGLPGALGSSGGTGTSGYGASGIGSLLSSLGSFNSASPSTLAGNLNAFGGGVTPSQLSGPYMNSGILNNLTGATLSTM